MADAHELDIHALRLMVFDLDGVLTDGTVGLDDRGVEYKFYFARDGLGIRLAQRAGLRVGVISGRGAPSATLRLQELDVDLLIQKSGGKAASLTQLCQRAGATPEQVAFMGDDIVDLPAMRLSGYGMAVGDAAPEVREAADYVTEARGGRGAVREAIEHVLKGQGRWDQLVTEYLNQQ